MTHKEFMERLCHAVGDFGKQIGEDSGPCFCGENEIAKIEIERGLWRGSEALLNSVEYALRTAGLEAYRARKAFEESEKNK